MASTEVSTEGTTEHSKSEIVDAQNDVHLRLQWTIDSQCFIYSRSSMTWCDGQIIHKSIDTETNAEWLVVQYGTKKKRMQRFSACLKPISLGDGYKVNQKLILQISKELKANNVKQI